MYLLLAYLVCEVRSGVVVVQGGGDIMVQITGYAGNLYIADVRLLV